MQRKKHKQTEPQNIIYLNAPKFLRKPEMFQISIKQPLCFIFHENLLYD